MLISLLKVCHTVQHPRVASAEAPWIETALFEKCMCVCACVCARCLVQCYRAHYAGKALILWHSQRHFLRLCIYIQCIYNRLRHCATNRKIAGYIPDGVIGIFH